MQPNSRPPPYSSASGLADPQDASADAGSSPAQPGELSLKQKLLLRKAAENIAPPRDAQENVKGAPHPASAVSPHIRVKGASSLQSSFSRLAVTAEDHQRLIEAELAKVRACIVKTRGFSSLEQQHLDALIKSGRRSVYDAQEALIVQHDDNVGYFFVLIEGAFKYVVESDSEVSKTGFISSSDHGNMVGHFGSLYQRRRDSSVFSVPGAVAWRFSLDGIPGSAPPSAPPSTHLSAQSASPSSLSHCAGFVMRANDQAPHAPAAPRHAPASSSLELAESIARYSSEIEQLQLALERATSELHSARTSAAEYASRCESLETTASSLELQLQAMLSQAASDKSSFLQEKERLQLLFDKQQQLCISLTSQVVALTANCERLQSEADCNTEQQQLESARHAKELEAKDAAIAIERQKCLTAACRASDLEGAIIDLQSKRDSLQSLNAEQAKDISRLSQQLEEASRKIQKHEQDALMNERKTRGCQTVNCDDLARSSLVSSVDAAKSALQWLEEDCNQVLMQSARDIQSSQIQIEKARYCLSEKEKQLERVVADAEQRHAASERAFEQQLRALSIELRQKSDTCSRAVGEAQEETRQLQRMLAQAQAESRLQAREGQLNAAALAQHSLESHNQLLLQENAELEGSVTRLRSLLSDGKGGAADSLALATSTSSSTRDLALIAHLESRAKDSEQRAESMLFQKNEAQSRCQMAELSLDHFQRLCSSSLSLLRANIGSSAGDLSLPSASAQEPNATVSHSRNLVQEAGELLAAAASKWAAEDIESVSAADRASAEVPLVTLLDEIHRLRLQLSVQHVHVINCYAEGLKQFASQQQQVTKAQI